MNPLIDAIARHASRSPQTSAIRGQDDGLTWSVLHRCIWDLAPHLAGHRIALLADNGPGWMIADLAAMVAGATIVPVPPFFSPGQIQHVLASAGVDLLVCGDPGLARAIDPDGDLMPVVCGTSRLWISGRSAAPVDRVIHGSAKISFTSGTTGAPKGAILTSAAQVTVAESLVGTVGAGPDDRSLGLLPLAVLLENITAYATLLGGGCLHLPPLRSTGVTLTGVDAGSFRRSLDAHRPSALVLVPGLLRALVAMAENGARPATPPRFIAVGGAPCGPDLLRRAACHGLVVYEGYGLTEATSVTTLNLPGMSRTGSVGRPLPHARVLVDRHGQIHVGGTLFEGYVGKGPAPADFHATGDLGHVDEDGFLFVQGRCKDVIALANGRKVAPEWVEGHLLDQDVFLQAAVFGHGSDHLAALLVLKPGVPDGVAAAAVASANRQLPAYARIGGFAPSPRPFSHLHGEVTGNGRLRRDRIARNFAATLESLLLETHDVVL